MIGKIFRFPVRLRLTDDTANVLASHDMTHIFTVDNRAALAPDHTTDIVADMRITDFTFVGAVCHRAGRSSGDAACVISCHDVLRQIQRSDIDAV